MSPAPLPPPGHRLAPKYWMDEVGGQLRIAVENYLCNRHLSLREIAYMRWYFRQWVDSPVWDLNPAHDADSRLRLENLRLDVDEIGSVKDIRKWLREADDQGMDPL